MNSGGAGHSGKATDPRPYSGRGGRGVSPLPLEAWKLRVFHFLKG